MFMASVFIALDIAKLDIGNAHLIKYRWQICVVECGVKIKNQNTYRRFYK